MKKLMKKISKTFLVIAMTMAMTFSFTVIPADAYSLENVVENETATITPVEDEFVGNAEKNIFSNAHFKVACSVPFTTLTFNPLSVIIFDTFSTSLTVAVVFITIIILIFPFSIYYLNSVYK